MNITPIITALVASATVVASAAQSQAQEFNHDGWTKDGIAVFETAPVSDATARQIRDANAHALRTWENTRDAGGCNADFIPTEIAIHCFNYAVGNYPLDGSIGSKGGD